MSKILKQFISEVETKDGAIFKIGDTVIHQDKSSRNYHKPSVIEKFEINNKGVIRAFTDFKYNSGSKPNGIDINKLELVITPKLPEEWYIVITNENRHLVQSWGFTLGKGHYSYTVGAYYGVKNNNVFQANGSILNMTGNEITTEQFKKYVFNLNN